MHPQLSDKKIVCKDIIQALEACHRSNWARLTGQCNLQKNQLNACLRAERISRTTKNRDTAKELNSKTQQALKDFRELDL